jgi:hypothetical protein
MSHKHESKKEKKKAQIKKNRFQQEIFNALRLRRAEEERVKDLDKAGKPKPGKSSDEAWSDKVSTIRNRLTGKKRLSTERWNRFSGTGDAGGRGL